MIEKVKKILNRIDDFARGGAAGLDFDEALKALLLILPFPKDRPPWGVIVNDLEDALLQAKIEDILDGYGNFMDGYDADGKVLDIDEAAQEICQLFELKPDIDLREDMADIIFPFRWFYSNNRDDALDLADQILAKAAPIVDKQARQDEREKLFREAEMKCKHYGNAIETKWVKRCCDDCWQELKRK